MLHEAIRAVAGGDAVLTPRITRDLVDRFAQAAPWPRDEAAGALFTQLTARERDVFHLIATGLTNADIARHLHPTEATVKTHITCILGKLQLRDRVQVVIFAYEHGLRPTASERSCLRACGDDPARGRLLHQPVGEDRQEKVRLVGQCGGDQDRARAAVVHAAGERQ